MDTTMDVSHSLLWFNLHLAIFSLLLSVSPTMSAEVNEDSSVWYQMPFPQHRDSPELPVRLFTNNLLIWKHNGVLRDVRNYRTVDGKAPNVERVCPHDNITLEPQPKLTYVIDVNHFINVKVPPATAVVHFRGKSIYDEVDKTIPHGCYRDSVSLVFPTQKTISFDFFDVNNWESCQQYPYCKHHLDDVSVKSHHIWFDFPLDAQLLPSPGSQFLVPDKSNGPSLKSLSLKPREINITQLQKILGTHKLKRSQRVSLCKDDDEFRKRVCPHFANSNHALDCENPIKPSCSCRKHCGTLLTTPVDPYSEKISDIYSFIDRDIKVIKEPADTKNMAIVEKGEKCQDDNKCQYFLQIAFNQSLTVDLSEFTNTFSHYQIDRSKPRALNSSNYIIGAIFLTSIFVLMVIAFFWFRARQESSSQRIQMSTIVNQNNVGAGELEIFGNHTFQKPTDVDRTKGGSKGTVSRFFGGKDRTREGFQNLNSSTMDLISDGGDDDIDDIQMNPPVIFDADDPNNI